MAEFCGFRDLRLTVPFQGCDLCINLDMAVIEGMGKTDDQLANVVCYETMAANIRSLVMDGAIGTAGALAERIAAMSLREPRVRRVRVRVELADAVSDAAGAGIEIERTA